MVSVACLHYSYTFSIVQTRLDCLLTPDYSMDFQLVYKNMNFLVRVAKVVLGCENGLNSLEVES